MNHRDTVFKGVRLSLDQRINNLTTTELRMALMDNVWDDAWTGTRNLNVNSLLKMIVDDELERHIK